MKMYKIKNSNIKNRRQNNILEKKSYEHCIYNLKKIRTSPYIFSLKNF